jgi:hypothetical protein
VEAPGAFMEPSPGVSVRSSRRYTLVAEEGGTWAAVEGIRLAAGEAAAAVAEVHEFLEQTGTTIASWWLSDRSTPSDAEAQLLGAGLELIDDDYLIDGMLATSAPPPAPAGIEARAVADVDEYVEAQELQYEVFETPPERRRTRAATAARHAASADVVYAAWVDGRMAAAARATFASCGVLLTGGATLPWARGRGAYRALVRARWDDAVRRGTPALAVGAGAMSAPILHGLGFEKLVQFRRLQSSR